MFGARKLESGEPSPYASRADFCRIFETKMNGLYLLSSLLTADQTLAEQCFVGGLHISQEGNHIFREWAESWARRSIVLNAIRIVRPRLTADDTPPPPAKDRSAWPEAAQPPEMAQVMELPTFERFVFVMSVLEGYSDQECSLHLGCGRGDVVAARSRALKRLGKYAEIANIASGQEKEQSNRLAEIIRYPPATKPIARLVPASS